MAAMLAVRLAYGTGHLRGTASRTGLGASVAGLRYLSQAPASVRDTRLQGEHAGIAVIELDRSKAMNALGNEVLAQLRDAVARIRGDDSVRAVIIKSNVPKVFCAGADLKERATLNQAQVKAMVNTLRSTFTEIESLPVPTIAAINGVALGGGLELALACDIRVAGQHSKIGLPETRLAIIPGAGGTQRLPRIIGVAKAKELIYTARVLDAVGAEKMGVVNYAVEGCAFDRALELAIEILPNGPVAVRMAKVAIDQGSEVERGAAMAIEEACYAQVVPTQDRLEGLAAFAQKRKPVYQGK